MILYISIVVSAGSVVVMWAYMCFVSAQRNGWTELVERYGSSQPFQGERFGAQSATLNGFAFTATLTLGASVQGLYLRGGPLLYLYHSPLLVPWHELGGEAFKRAHSSGYHFRFHSLPEMSLELSDATLARLASAVGSQSGAKPPWQRQSPA